MPASREDLTWHDLRHTAATRTLRASGNLRAVQKMLGHRRIETTVKYAHATRDDVRDAMNAAAESVTPPPHKTPHETEDPPAKLLKSGEK